MEPKFLTKRFKLTSTTTPLSVEWFYGYNSLLKLPKTSEKTHIFS
jgi:hypothetical protein